MTKPTDVDLKDRIGVSTLCLKGFTPEQGIERTLAAGFGAFELTPVTYGGPQAFDTQRRENLRELLAPFHQVTVHSSSMGNIADTDTAEREAACQRYRDLVQLALDLEADVATVHPGRSAPDAFAANVAMGKEMVELAGDSDLALGFELFDVEVARQVGNDNFGALFDVGHASCRGPTVDTDDVLGMIDEMADQIVQFHVHGVGAPDKTDHLPFVDNTWLDYERIVRRIVEMPFDGPIILEIGIRGTDGELNLRDCALARDALVGAIW